MKLQDVMPDYRFVKAADLIGVGFYLHSGEIIDTKFGTAIRFTCSDANGVKFTVVMGDTGWRRALVEKLTGEPVGPITVRKDGNLYVFEDTDSADALPEPADPTENIPF